MSVNNSQFTPFMANNPFLNAVINTSQPAAYSQNINQLLWNFGGEALPTVSYPNWNPFGNYLTNGTTIPGFQGLGFPATWNGNVDNIGTGSNPGPIPTTNSNGGSNGLPGTTANANSNPLSLLSSLLSLNTGTTNGLGGLGGLQGNTGGLTTNQTNLMSLLGAAQQQSLGMGSFLA
jgi:hypothetical protein